MFMPEDDFNRYFKMVEDLCTSHGLIKTVSGNEIEFVTEVSNSIYGEVIRFFPKYLNIDYLVFFNKLNVPKSLMDKPGFVYNFFDIPEEFIDILDTDNYGYGKNKILLEQLDGRGFKLLEYIVKNAVRQYKEFKIDCKLDRIKEDFE